MCSHEQRKVGAKAAVIGHILAVIVPACAPQDIRADIFARMCSHKIQRKVGVKERSMVTF
jgi:hypothetical protein